MPAFPLLGVIFPAEDRDADLDHRHDHIHPVHIAHPGHPGHLLGALCHNGILQSDAEHGEAHLFVHLRFGLIGIRFCFEHGEHWVGEDDAV